MASQVREMIEEIPTAFLPDKAGDAEALFQLDLSGDDGGQWMLEVAEGACTVQEGVASQPDVTVKMGSKDFVALLGNELDPVRAFMGGKIRVSGSVGLVMRLLQWFER
jgi:putative sterol carrier protein